MKVLIRADASPIQGTGHVMRCLTLAEELIRRGNNVSLMTNRSGIEWLEEIIELTPIEVIEVNHHELPFAKCLALSPDFVVIDSYQISAEEISNLADHLPVLAIVDGDTRGIIATEYLDHNLGAELTEWPKEVSGRIMAGSSFALIREAVLQGKRENPWIFEGRSPHIVAVMGVRPDWDDCWSRKCPLESQGQMHRHLGCQRKMECSSPRIIRG